MRKDKPSTLYNSKDIFHQIGDSLRNGKNNANASNYASMKSKVEAQINKYDTAVASTPNTLAKLQSIWNTNCQEERTAYNMYSTSRNQIIALRNDLLKINGGGDKYTCPLCGIEKVHHLDHYIPRGIMSEFSVVPINLIYICRDCNESKGEKWLDKNGDRIVFNSYYDQLSGKEVLLCQISKIINGYPFAEIIENNSVVHNADSKRELSTYKELGIMGRYQTRVNELLRQECIRLTIEAKRRKLDGQKITDIWSNEKSLYSECLASNNMDMMNTFLYNALLASPILENWLDKNS